MENIKTEVSGADIARCAELLDELCGTAAEIAASLDDIRAGLSGQSAVINISADGAGIDELLRSSIGAVF